MTRLKLTVIAISSVALVGVGLLTADTLMRMRADQILAEQREEARRLDALDRAADAGVEAVTRELFATGACVRQADGSASCR